MIASPLVTPASGTGVSNEVVIVPPKSLRRLPAPPVSPNRFVGGQRHDLSAEQRDQLDSFAKSLHLDDFKAGFNANINVVALRVEAKGVGKLLGDPNIASHVLRASRIASVVEDPTSPKQNRFVLLNYSAQDELPGSLTAAAVQQGLALVKHVLHVNYNYFTADQVISSLLPASMPEGTPTAYTLTGHIAHVNLRDDYLPYRFVISQVLLEKNASVRTVVNKLDSIDTEFRFFAMELLAGESSYQVELSESGCLFSFDFRQVYWNSRLHTEHARLISLFSPYDVVSDVMAGVGPFAIPAAKKGCWVLANDLNPASYGSLKDNCKRNRVDNFCTAACEDGRTFIRNSIKQTWEEGFDGKLLVKGGAEEATSRRARLKEERKRRQEPIAQGTNGDNHPTASAAQPPARGRRRRLIDHFVMNLPGSALEFLDAYRGAYRVIGDQTGLEKELKERKANEEENGSEWPMVHVHCFTKDLEHPFEDICRRANEALGLDNEHPAALVPPRDGHNAETPTKQEVSIHLVRSVAPNKDMYCLSFRLSREILLDLPMQELQ
ncbi:hypothetical protein K437DRAFT_270837 [Tilletiaria anomala UBC 951]|uniref:tRNA (guanine(37)-N1)-methyltransferase n=1 Tax=Tilletiaria anomala (strain ATCC 24038 / CBS 436.72 / UBC 951) TaxID=1037660 RepID=A0A066V7S3_TILAU|nr:uncharacterized protein K437DRAFT_270837 [Tilletiaria anomala UBC 951]KDN37526.1 hypothetical protein K437DRAFT_270837 [Tilletiaria anomala UBC 951]